LFEQDFDIIQSRNDQNDLIAFDLLKRVSLDDQFAILSSINKFFLKSLMSRAIQAEEYELCQVIFELMKNGV
jgi:hypothetical protein